MTRQPVRLRQGTKQYRQGAKHEGKAAHLADPDPRDFVMLLRCTVGGEPTQSLIRQTHTWTASSPLPARRSPNRDEDLATT
ncbi:hypothetical protein GCM10027615_37260 [Plantactinospora veratri]